jgi:hypothetical protein
MKRFVQWLKKLFLEDKPHPKGDEIYGAKHTIE